MQCATSNSMISVGIRELRQRASELLRRVEQGETVEITDRGRPVALLSPVPAGSPLEQLRATGDLEIASADVDDLAAPVEVEAGLPLPSEILARLRDDER
jgi:prevent-host-death family protein